MCLIGRFGVVKILAEHNDYNIFISIHRTIPINISSKDYMNQTHKPMKICQLKFDLSPKKRTKTLITLSPEGKQTQGDTKCPRNNAGGTFIPRHCIRSQVHVEKIKLSKVAPITPATLTYSKFPQRRHKTSIQRLSVFAPREKKCYFGSQASMGGSYYQHPHSTLPIPFDPQKDGGMARSCMTLNARDKFMRYSCVNQQRMKLKSLHMENEWND